MALLRCNPSQHPDHNQHRSHNRHHSQHRLRRHHNQHRNLNLHQLYSQLHNLRQRQHFLPAIVLLQIRTAMVMAGKTAKAVSAHLALQPLQRHRHHRTPRFQFVKALQAILMATDTAGNNHAAAGLADPGQQHKAPPSFANQLQATRTVTAGVGKIQRPVL